jgi:nudix-type nucleoside diphosphatase (YffH/AdpP family)
MAGVRIKSTEIVSDSHYKLKKVKFDLQKNDGSWESHEKEVFDHGNAATALLYNKEQRTVILTKQFRIPTYLNGNPSGMLMETCAGLLEEGESPADTMKREIKEETGYAVGDLQKIYEAYTSAGSVTEMVYFYLAEYTKEQKVSEGGGLKEEGEDIKILELNFDEALQRMDNGEIKDVKTILLLQYVRLKQLL